MLCSWSKSSVQTIFPSISVTGIPQSDPSWTRSRKVFQVQMESQIFHPRNTSRISRLTGLRIASVSSAFSYRLSLLILLLRRHPLCPLILKIKLSAKDHSTRLTSWRFIWVETQALQAKCKARRNQQWPSKRQLEAGRRGSSKRLETVQIPKPMQVSLSSWLTKFRVRSLEVLAIVWSGL